MKEFERPVVLVSKCLEHEACRYDGTMIGNSFVRQLKDYVDFIPVCPEMEIGLKSPREALRNIKDDVEERLVSSYSGEDYSRSMSDFSEKYLKDISDRKIHGAVLKSKSPSCGFRDVKTYLNTGKAPSTGDKTSGFFGRAMEGLDVALEDEGRLSNYNIREHFLTRIYTLSDFDAVKDKRSMKELIAFQSRNKYLLMSYHQSGQKVLGKIVANHQGKPLEKVLDEYEIQLKISLSKPLRRKTNINMLLHIFGYFKEDLTKEEKSYFLDVLEKYHSEKMPYLVPLNLLKAWVVRFEENYLMSQTIFEPFPHALLDLNDSGKGRV